jgi:sialic acid synthase SpsE
MAVVERRASGQNCVHDYPCAKDINLGTISLIVENFGCYVSYASSSLTKILCIQFYELGKSKIDQHNRVMISLRCH